LRPRENGYNAFEFACYIDEKGDWLCDGPEVPFSGWLLLPSDTALGNRPSIYGGVAGVIALIAGAIFSNGEEPSPHWP